ncbi:arginase family protein [Inquilinus limosus]|uniref:Arginase n=1 Tax=Inquilinus limosus TaxID=171674 RepID=A0A211ZRH8_9PROT|nr:arginase family protein [Inquilinus limosus]OWJ67794.1 arginase [Inquilinus limosus]
MTNDAGTTLRLIMPQWQGGDEQGYFFGSRLLAWLAPEPTGPVETVPVPEPQPGETLVNEAGIVARAAVKRQAQAARALIDKHRPDRIVTIGGDCLVDLAPMAYLNERYGGSLGVLWVDAHPDVVPAEHYPNAHAHVLGALLERADPDLTAEVRQPIQPSRVMYAGLDTWSRVEGEIIESLDLRRAGSEALADSSAPVLDWIAEQEITRLAIHFDLDVLDPALFGPLLFNRPGLPAGAYPGVPRGRMTPEQVVRLLGDVAAACDVVGLALAEHLPWEALATRDLLRRLPLLAG